MSVKQPTKKSKKSTPDTPPGFLKRHAFSITLFILAFVVFGNTIPNSYALDDEFYTAGANTYTQKGFKGLPEIFTSRTFKNKDGSGYQYRPIALASFAIEIQLFGEKAGVSHFFNVLLYALTVLIVFRLLRRWFKAENDWLAFFVALLFLVHPLHTECVANIKCRDELLAILAGFSSIWCIHRFRETGKWWFAVLYPLCFAFGMLAKQTVMPFFIVIPLILWFFTDLNWKRIIVYMLPLAVAMLATMLLMRFMLPKNIREFQSFENPFDAGIELADKLAIVSHVLGRYLWLHFVPHPLVYYYGYDYVPHPSWSDPVTLISIPIYLTLVVLAFIGLRKKTIWGFGIAFYLCNIIFYCNLIRPAPGLMAERYTYASSLGFCIVAIWGIFYLFRVAPEKFQWRLSSYSTARNIIFCLIAIYAIRSIVRNEDWENKDTLYGNDIQYLEESAKANMLIGALMADHGIKSGMQGQQLMKQAVAAKNRNLFMSGQQKMDSAKQFFTEANRYYKQATVIAPDYQIAWSNLGSTYVFLGNSRDAIPCFKKAIEVKPNYAAGMFNIAVQYDSLHMPDSAFYYYALCLKTDSSYADAYNPWMRQFLQRDPAALPIAIKILKRATVLSPKSDLPWNSLTSLYLQLGDTVSSLAAVEKAAEINPGNISRLRKLANYYKRTGNTEKATFYQSKLAQEEQKQQLAQRKRKR